MIDCFMFLNEFDLLEVRLNHLAPYVRKFVLCEAPITHSGKPKPLYFQEYKTEKPDEFAKRFGEFNITHLVADDGMTPKQTEGRYANESDAWRREHYQREYLWHGFDDVSANETILISDVDEIPNLEKYCVEGMEGFFRQKLYYFYVNLFAAHAGWRGTLAVQKKNIVPFDTTQPNGNTITLLRQGRNRAPALTSRDHPGGKGWHFSTLGSQADVIYKFQSIAHTELDNPSCLRKIVKQRAKLSSPYHFVWGRNSQPYSLEMPDGPTYLLDHRERFRHFFYEPANDKI